MSVSEIKLAGPDITEHEIALVEQVLRSGRLSIGPMLERFEDAMCLRLGRTRAVGVSSGTAGLHLALVALGIGPGDEVVTTPFSFIASANVILYVGARPVFVDVDPKSLNMDPARVEQAITPRTKAILAVEALGNPSHMAEYEAIAKRHEIPLIEDSCEALGGRNAGRPCGSFGRVSVFGFYPNKQITTGEGGMIVTDDDRLADRCLSLRNQGRPASKDVGDGGIATGSWLAHERLGFNYRMDEMSAALGVGQMDRLDKILAKRGAVADMYFSALSGNAHLVLPNVDDRSEMSWFVFVPRLESTFGGEERDRIIAGMRRHEIGAANYFPCIHLQPFYRERFGYKEGDFPIAERVSQRTIALPFHTGLTPQDIDLVSQTLELMIARETHLRGEEWS